mmetsp:Transcript_2931/g.6169  ORF Transcript_2931/g.6169 Transcript_2931/m.6169 type:complete len:96 (+) Transcript_2931:33-320(+)
MSSLSSDQSAEPLRHSASGGARPRRGGPGGPHLGGYLGAGRALPARLEALVAWAVARSGHLFCDFISLGLDAPGRKDQSVAFTLAGGGSSLQSRV